MLGFRLRPLIALFAVAAAFVMVLSDADARPQTGGLGGFASLLGLLLQTGIAALIGYLLWSWWQRRSQPAYAGGPAMHGMSPAGSSYGSGGGGPEGTASGTDEVGLTPDDYNTFERMLGEIQTAYGAEDLTKLRTLMVPEAVAYSSDEMTTNASSGVINRLADIKLLQGDLAEAWREGDIDFATVVLRYSLVDQTVDRATGRVVKVGPSEATERWTFMRKHGGGKWLLSDIEEAS